MKRILIFVYVLTAFAAPGQNKINQYEYWFDGNYAVRQQQTITGTPQYFLNTGFSTASLSAGLHCLHLRFKDDSSKYSNTISQFFYNKAAGPAASASINAIQYWFDNNFSAAGLQTITLTPAANVNLALNAAALSDGLHLLHIRGRDINNQWSSTISQFLYKANPSGATGTNGITAFQYWFDSQPGQAQTTAINPAEQLQFSAALPTHLLTKGLHTLQLRFLDKTNQWSTVSSQFVYITNPANASITGISKMQYWFDNKIENALTKPVAIQPVLVFSSLIPANNLTRGLHTLHFRFADTVGQWSATQSNFFYKTDSIGMDDNRVTAYRYWFNNDSAGSMVVHATLPQNILLLNREIDLGCLTPGINRLQLQFRDAKGLWSTAISETINLLFPASSVYRFNGNGNWSNAANWQNNAMPALDLPGCREIIIDHAPGGQCILDIPQYLLKNAKLTVLTGKHLIIPQQLEIK
jgi:hypothetical protein